MMFCLHVIQYRIRCLRVTATDLLQQLATCPVQRMNVEVGKIVDRFPPQAMQRHAEAVAEARQAGRAVGLHQNVTRFDVTANRIASHHAIHQMALPEWFERQ